MSAYERLKGQRGEREVAALFKAHGWPDARRRSSGEESQTAQGRDLADTAPWCVQVHYGDHPNPLKKLGEARAAAVGEELPVAFSRKTSGAWAATMDAPTFFLLAEVFAAFGRSFPKRVEEMRGGTE